MTKTTFDRRLAQLIEQVRNHPNRDEVLRLAMEQLSDDSYADQFTINQGRTLSTHALRHDTALVWSALHRA
jgi:hypothetical protein